MAGAGAGSVGVVVFPALTVTRRADRSAPRVTATSPDSIEQDQHALARDRRPAGRAQVRPAVERVMTEGEVHLVERGACGHGPTVVGVEPEDLPVM